MGDIVGECLLLEDCPCWEIDLLNSRFAPAAVSTVGGGAVPEKEKCLHLMRDGGGDTEDMPDSVASASFSSGKRKLRFAVAGDAAVGDVEESEEPSASTASSALRSE